ncbi:hypothetical protein [Nostoc sp. C110]|uniref:IS1096 element passenger TnpR family protein n=1 Tax=Nostoc sp. C110 TaxID=3349876 RepID=UPI00370DDF1A
MFLIDGPITEEFAAENPVVSRTIEIESSNTLQDLHKIIFKAFDREEEHIYEFQVGGKRAARSKCKTLLHKTSIFKFRFDTKAYRRCF